VGSNPSANSNEAVAEFCSRPIETISPWTKQSARKPQPTDLSYGQSFTFLNITKKRTDEYDDYKDNLDAGSKLQSVRTAAVVEGSIIAKVNGTDTQINYTYLQKIDGAWKIINIDRGPAGI